MARGGDLRARPPIVGGIGDLSLSFCSIFISPRSRCYLQEPMKNVVLQGVSIV